MNGEASGCGSTDFTGVVNLRRKRMYLERRSGQATIGSDVNLKDQRDKERWRERVFTTRLVRRIW